MKDIAKLIGIPFAICLLAGLLLAAVHGFTKEPIRQAELKQKMDAIRKALPAHDNLPVETTYAAIGADGATNAVFYVASRDGIYVGAAWEAVSRKGYAGDIRIMIGVNADNAVQGIEILPGHKETPGLGAKIQGDKFKNKFSDKSIADTVWRVDKDGGAIQAITAATISSRAVTEAVAAALKDYLKHEEAIRALISGTKP